MSARAIAGALSLGLATALFAPPAGAQSKGDDQPDFMRAPISATRRHGFTFGVTAAPESVWMHGTPTAYAQRTREYEVQLGPSIAPSVSGHLGYAIADELSFTLVLEPALLRRDDTKISGLSAAFRIEAWPFTSSTVGARASRALRDVGFAVRAGLGSARVTRASTGDSLASSGTYSLVGLDLLWDAARLGGFGLGPTLGVTVRASETYHETDLLLGLRVVFYGGP